MWAKVSESTQVDTFFLTLKLRCLANKVHVSGNFKQQVYGYVKSFNREYPRSSTLTHRDLRQ